MKKWAQYMIATASMLVSSAAFAQSSSSSGRAAAGQVEYLGDLGNMMTVTALAFLFFTGIVIIGIAGWFTFRDYVLEQREKKFSIGGLLLSVVLGAILCYPAVAMVLGQDLAGPDPSVQEINGDDFKRN